MSTLVAADLLLVVAGHSRALPHSLAIHDQAHNLGRTSMGQTGWSWPYLNLLPINFENFIGQQVNRMLNPFTEYAMGIDMRIHSRVHLIATWSSIQMRVRELAY